MEGKTIPFSPTIDHLFMCILRAQLCSALGFPITFNVISSSASKLFINCVL